MKAELNELEIKIELEKDKQPMIVVLKGPTFSDRVNLLKAEQLHERKLAIGDLTMQDPYLTFASNNFKSWRNMPIFKDQNDKEIVFEDFKAMVDADYVDCMIIFGKIKTALITHLLSLAKFEKK